MVAISTDAREQVTNALAAALPVDVVSPAPEVPLPPMVAVTHGTPWQEPTTGGRGMDIQLRCLVTTRYSGDNVAQLEDLVEQVLAAIPDGWWVTTVTAPAQLDTGAQGVVLVSEVHLTASFAPPTP